MPFRVETLITGIGGAPGYNRMHFDDVSFPGETGADAAASAAQNFWEAISVRVVSSVTFAVQSEVTQVDSAGATIGVFLVDTPLPVQGTETSTPNPWAVQGLLRLRTGIYVGGRETRGRIFIPGMSVGSVSNGRVEASTQQIVNLAAATLADNDPALVVLGKNGPAPVASAVMWSEWSYLSSRRD